MRQIIHDYCIYCNYAVYCSQVVLPRTRRGPLRAELLGPLTGEEGEPGGVGRPDRVVKHRGVEQPAEPVAGQDVHPLVEHEGWQVADRVEQELHRGPHRGLSGLLASRRAGPLFRVGDLDQVRQVFAFGLVELECVRHGFEHTR
jgi:hypothetical protein